MELIGNRPVEEMLGWWENRTGDLRQIYVVTLDLFGIYEIVPDGSEIMLVVPTSKIRKVLETIGLSRTELSIEIDADTIEMRTSSRSQGRFQGADDGTTITTEQSESAGSLYHRSYLLAADGDGAEALHQFGTAVRQCL